MNILQLKVTHFFCCCKLSVQKMLLAFCRSDQIVHKCVFWHFYFIFFFKPSFLSAFSPGAPGVASPPTAGPPVRGSTGRSTRSRFLLATQSPPSLTSCSPVLLLQGGGGGGEGPGFGRQQGHTHGQASFISYSNWIFLFMFSK